MSESNGNNAPLIRKLDEMSKRHAELQHSLGDPAILACVLHICGSEHIALRNSWSDR